MLEALAGMGIAARGVDSDPDAVEEATAAGLAATRADVLEYFASMADETLGGIFAGHLLEQMAPDDAADLLRLASLKLQRGGRLVVVGYNPSSIHFQASAWYSDPANLRPVPPELVELLLRKWGFSDIVVEPFGPTPSGLTPSPENESQPVASVDKRNLERLNQLLFPPLEQAIFATR
jgi:hypothetical protein